MATVVHKSTLELRKSVNTPDYPEADWFVNPTLPDGTQRDWVNDAGTLRAMTAQEKTARDEAEATARAASESAAADKFEIDPKAAVIAIAKVLVAKGVATKAEIKAALMAEVRE